jgi:hypothetical protein
MVLERWLPITGWEGLYEVSDQGRVRSLDRTVTTKHGVVKQHRGKILSPGKLNSGHLVVNLRGHNHGMRCVHRLVLESFVGSCPEGMEACHDPDPTPSNNRLDNLRWDTHVENLADMRRAGRHHYSRRTHCKYGHEFTPENTMRRHDGDGRRCKKCWARIQRGVRARKRRAAA